MSGQVLVTSFFLTIFKMTYSSANIDNFKRLASNTTSYSQVLGGQSRAGNGRTLSISDKSDQVLTDVFVSSVCAYFVKRIQTKKKTGKRKITIICVIESRYEKVYRGLC